MNKVLIIQTAFIGDVILATPLIEKIKQHYPSSRIDFLLRKENEGLLENHPKLNRLIIWDKKENKIRNLISCIKYVRKQKYDYVINLQRFASTGLITILSKGKTKIGFSKNPLSLLFTKSFAHLIGNRKHEIERNLSLIERETDNITAKPCLYPNESDFLKVSAYKKSNYITIAPTSVWFTKQYPIEKWIEFVNLLPKNLLIYLIGGNADKEKCNQIIAKTSHPVQNLAGELSFLQTVALMKDATMNFVNDSAPLHMASSVNAPVYAIFCSTVPDFGFYPLSDNSRIIEAREPLKCRPCGLHGHSSCPEGHFKCAYNIKTEDLLNF